MSRTDERYLLLVIQYPCLMYHSYKIFSKSITDNVVVSYHLYSSNMSTLRNINKIMVTANKI